MAGLIPPGHQGRHPAHRFSQPVRRYDQIIGVAAQDIDAGRHVHVHNLAMAEFARDYAFCVDAKPTDHVSEPATFLASRGPTASGHATASAC